MKLITPIHFQNFNLSFENKKKDTSLKNQDIHLKHPAQKQFEKEK